jgi:beta-mannosidase
LQRSIPADALTPDSPSMLHHQKADGGNDKLNTRLAEHFEIPENFDDWLYVTQLNQARALTVGVEWFRSRQPVCMGSIYWQINDCWPVTSWASVDGYGRLKPLWYATRRFYAERLLTVQAENEGLNVYASNDTDSEWQGDFELLVLNLSGETVLSETFSHTIAPRSCEAVMRTGELGSFTFDASTQYVCVRSAEARTVYFGATDKELRYPEPQFQALLEPGNGTQRLTITAQSLLRDLCIFADRLDPEATVSEQLVTLLPGESFTFEICTTQPLSEQELAAPPVLQCANRFGRKA